MTVVGVTGHSNITSATYDLVRAAIANVLRSDDGDIVGLTCLARGADQAFADAVLDVGGSLSIIIPASDYFENISDPVTQARCQRYLDIAATTVEMDYATSGPEAYLAASRHLVDHCDQLIAVWDGTSATGQGGTADAVNYAKRRMQRITVIWPDAAERSG